MSGSDFVCLGCAGVTVEHASECQKEYDVELYECPHMEMGHAMIICSTCARQEECISLAQLKKECQRDTLESRIARIVKAVGYRKTKRFVKGLTKITTEKAI